MKRAAPLSKDDQERLDRFWRNVLRNVAYAEKRRRALEDEKRREEAKGE